VTTARAGDVVAVDLGLSEGSEAGFAHPAVVVTAERILASGPSVVQIVPLTSTVRGFGSEVILEPDATNGLSRTSAAQCQHIRAVSPTRIVDIRGNVGPLALRQVRETIAVLLDLS
jgi:mRNA interferase MazF